jgi:hypothetical protein
LTIYVDTSVLIAAVAVENGFAIASLDKILIAAAPHFGVPIVTGLIPN